MNNKRLIFYLNNDAQLSIVFNKPITKINFFDKAFIVLIIDNKKFIITNCFIHDFIDRLASRLRLILLHESSLNLYKICSLGYEWNQWLNESFPNIMVIEGKEGDYWPGINYFVYGTKGSDQNKFAIWLYKNISHNIVFQITPLFPGTIIDENNEIEIQEYKKWMENYESFFSCIISKKNAKTWLKKTELILKIIKMNT